MCQLLSSLYFVAGFCVAGFCVAGVCLGCDSAGGGLRGGFCPVCLFTKVTEEEEETEDVEEVANGHAQRVAAGLVVIHMVTSMCSHRQELSHLQLRYKYLDHSSQRAVQTRHKIVRVHYHVDQGAAQNAEQHKYINN